MGEKSLLEQ